MALEPYRPPSDDRYRDDLDREIDQKIDTFFHRWNWKLVRFIRRAVIVVSVIWVGPTAFPAQFPFFSPQPMGPVIFQLLPPAPRCSCSSGSSSRSCTFSWPARASTGLSLVRRV